MITTITSHANPTFGALVFNQHVSEGQQALLKANKALMDEVNYLDTTGEGFDVVICNSGSKAPLCNSLLHFFVCNKKQVQIDDFMNSYSQKASTQETLDNYFSQTPNPTITYLGHAFLQEDSQEDSHRRKIKQSSAIAQKVTDFHQQLDEMFKTLQAFGYPKSESPSE